jgi:hypothetical protein
LKAPGYDSDELWKHMPGIDQNQFDQASGQRSVASSSATSLLHLQVSNSSLPNLAGLTDVPQPNNAPHMGVNITAKVTRDTNNGTGLNHLYERLYLEHIKALAVEVGHGSLCPPCWVLGVNHHHKISSKGNKQCSFTGFFGSDLRYTQWRAEVSVKTNGFCFMCFQPQVCLFISL